MTPTYSSFSHSQAEEEKDAWLALITPLIDKDSNIKVYEDDDGPESLVPQVALTVLMTDDPSATTLTFQALMLGILSCILLSFLKALHDKEERPKGGLSRNQFFVVAFVSSFAYLVFPGYLFPMLMFFSWVYWIFPGSVIRQQLESGLHGLGLGAIGLDWSGMSSYLGSPWFVTANVAVGFSFVTYVVTSVTYWLNVYDPKMLPMFSDSLFTSKGRKYNILAIKDGDFHLDVEAYE